MTIGPAHQERMASHEWSHNSGLAHPRTGHARTGPTDVAGYEHGVALIVPWRGGDPQRERVWTWCREYWEAHYPEYQIVECDSGDVPFTRGRSINQAVEKTTGEILLFADADTLAGHVEELVVLAKRGYWAIGYPQGRYCALTEPATETLLASDPAAELLEPTALDCRDQITSYSGILAMPRAAFEKIGGMDERFLGWGHEDFALMFALDTLWRPHERASGWAVHLYHEHREEERFDQPNIARNKELVDEYQNYFGNASAMARMIRER